MATKETKKTDSGLVCDTCGKEVKREDALKTPDAVYHNTPECSGHVTRPAAAGPQTCPECGHEF